MLPKKCKMCGVPLLGWISKIPKLFGIDRSEEDIELCNRCEKKKHE